MDKNEIVQTVNGFTENARINLKNIEILKEMFLFFLK